MLITAIKGRLKAIYKKKKCHTNTIIIIFLYLLMRRLQNLNTLLLLWCFSTKYMLLSLKNPPNFTYVYHLLGFLLSDKQSSRRDRGKDRWLFSICTFHVVCYSLFLPVANPVTACGKPAGNIYIHTTTSAVIYIYDFAEKMLDDNRIDYNNVSIVTINLWISTVFCSSA